MFYVYILQSRKLNKFYIGISANIVERLKAHNSGQVQSTKAGVPWNKVYQEIFDNHSEATKRENYIKSVKKRSYIENLIKHF